jgi:hypothetical protein
MDEPRRLLGSRPSHQEEQCHEQERKQGRVVGDVDRVAAAEGEAESGDETDDREEDAADRDTARVTEAP